MLKIGQNWGKIANYFPPNAQQRFAPLAHLYMLLCVIAVVLEEKRRNK